ncbi:MAG: DsbA family oxidoreductase [Vallitaleaceae bacterium]|jgi:predicted DsbA family dithiol-disulfide isomerase|nr:DsbA family oxidoreductase [Vallitaleaceae bacterium]
MKIEIWSDFVCPFCYIGKRNLEAAIEQVGIGDEVEVVYKSYQLIPTSKKSYDVGINELIAEKYDISIERATANNKNIVHSAKQVGLDFNFEDLKPTNTFDAHRLSHYAKAAGKMAEFEEVVMRSYFTDSLNISDEEVLLKAIDEIGLDRQEAQAILASTKHSDEVGSDIDQARDLQISGVPYFVFDGKVAISGAQPIESFVKVIKQSI